MFEHDGKLRTWAVELSPDTPTEQDATPLADHRLEYLTYEGEISGGRGHVTRWDEGEYVTLRDDVSGFVVKVTGRRMRGTIEITNGRFRFARSQH